MPSQILFFEKCEHTLLKLRKSYGVRPYLAAWKLGIWSLKQALGGNLLGDLLDTERRCAKGEPLSMAVILRGGIGDEIMGLAYIDALVRMAKIPCRVVIITACSVEILQCLCHKQPFIFSIKSIRDDFDASQYDIVLEITRNARVCAWCEQRIKSLSFPLYQYVWRLISFQQEHRIFYADDAQAMGIHHADVMGNFRRGQADFDASLNLKDSTFRLKSRVSWEEVASRFCIPSVYITIQREAGVSPVSLKLWSAPKYTALLHTLQKQFPHIAVVLLGTAKNFDAPHTGQSSIIDLRGRTQFDEFMALVQHSWLHIGGEGVVPHLRHYLHGGPSLVLFGPSCSRMLGYPENLALSGKECPNGCEGIMGSWQNQCLKGYAYCHSLEEITVEQVMQQVHKVV